MNTSGGSNVAVGQFALGNNTTASNNTAVGYQAGYSNTTGTINLFVGNAAGYLNTTGGANSFVGSYAAGYNNTSGSYNTAIGQEALASNTTASYNTAVGYQAGYTGTTAERNTNVGFQSGYAGTTGSYNTLLGMNAGFYVTTGSKNTIVGQYTGNQGGLDIRTSSNNIVLSDGDGNPRLYINSAGLFMIDGDAAAGANNGAYVSFQGNDSNCIETYRIGTGGRSHHVFYNGTFGSRSLVGSIQTSGSSTLYNTTSDYRLKENVVQLTGATDRIKQIPVHRFNFVSVPEITVDGFLAHEVQAIVPEAVSGEKDAVDSDGNIVPQGIDQSKLVPLLVATIKELEARITALENA